MGQWSDSSTPHLRRLLSSVALYQRSQRVLLSSIPQEVTRRKTTLDEAIAAKHESFRLAAGGRRVRSPPLTLSGALHSSV